MIPLYFFVFSTHEHKLKVLSNAMLSFKAGRKKIRHFCFVLVNYLGHRFPFNFLIVVVALKTARTLLERFRSKSYDFNTQFTHVSRHSGT